MALTRIVRWNRQVVARLAFVLLIAACLVPLVVLTLMPEQGPSIDIVGSAGGIRTVSLATMKRMPERLTRTGSAQNQYGNWRDQGIYSGVPIASLIRENDYSALEIEAADGYRITIPHARINDPEYPVILAFAENGVEVPSWDGGFRLVVLPEDGDVSNAEYGVESAGSYWVKRVVRVTVLPRPADNLPQD